MGDNQIDFAVRSVSKKSDNKCSWKRPGEENNPIICSDNGDRKKWSKENNSSERK